MTSVTSRAQQYSQGKLRLKEMGLQTTAENRQWLCRRDVVWQTVPNSRGCNRESSVAVRRQPRTAHNQRWWRGRT